MNANKKSWMDVELHINCFNQRGKYAAVSFEACNHINNARKATPISVQIQVDTQNTNTNLLGLTFALGAGFSVADQLKFLAVCGKDWAKGYIYNAESWCSVGIGYSLY